MEVSEKQRLMEWMKAAIDLETEIATQESIMNSYRKQHASVEPKLKEIPLPPKPKKPEYKSIDQNTNAMNAVMLVFGIVLLFIGFATLFLPDTNGGLKFLMFIATVPTGFGMCIPFFNTKKDKESNNELYENYHQKMENYNQELSKANAENDQKKANYQRDVGLWRMNGEDNLGVLNREIRKPKELLNQLYAQQYIYPKYCTLPALTSIYEYFITGRCDELTGPHGAYNLYEDEVRKDTVISQLSIVIENLEQIKQNQYMLYQQVKMIQQNTAEIDYELRQIKGLTFNIAQLSALNVYYAAITARNSEISATFHLLNG